MSGRCEAVPLVRTYKQMTNPKLTIELVPKTSWFNNMRLVLSKEDWDLVRRAAYRRQGYCCGICKATGRLNCHEIWSYNDTYHIQTLDGYIALCDMCHHVKHIGYASVLASKGKLNYQKVLEHMAKVNKWSIYQCHQYIDKALEIYQKRSQHEWVVDLSKFHKNVKN